MHVLLKQQSLLHAPPQRSLMCLQPPKTSLISEESSLRARAGNCPVTIRDFLESMFPSRKWFLQNPLPVRCANTFPAHETDHAIAGRAAWRALYSAQPLEHVLKRRLSRRVSFRQVFEFDSSPFLLTHGATWYPKTRLLFGVRRIAALEGVLSRRYIALVRKYTANPGGAAVATIAPFPPGFAAAEDFTHLQSIEFARPGRQFPHYDSSLF
jgi:hypothetical protein